MHRLKIIDNEVKNCTACNAGSSPVTKNFRAVLDMQSIRFPNYMFIDSSPSKLQCMRESHWFKRVSEENYLSRDSFYYTYLVKCYCEDIKKDNIVPCFKYLKTEIEEIDPRYIITTDGLVFDVLCKRYRGIRKSKFYKYKDRYFYYLKRDSEESLKTLCKVILRIECPF